MRLSVEDLAKLHFDEAALLFHHQDGVEARGKFGNEDGVERERHRDLADAQIVMNAEIAESLEEIVIRFADAEYADFGVIAGPVVEAVQAGVLASGFEPARVYFVLESQRD